MAKNKSYNKFINKSVSPETKVSEEVATDVVNEVSEPEVTVEELEVTEETSTVTTSEVPPSSPKSSTSTVKGFTAVYKIELELQNYMEALDPKKAINPEEGSKWQYSLYTILRNIFKAESQEQFNNEFNTVLAFFNKNRKKDNALSENFIYRPYMWPGGDQEYVVFRKLIQLIIETADPKVRKSFMQRVDLSKYLAEMTEAERQMLINFYG